MEWAECIESELALKPEQIRRMAIERGGVYRIGDRAQAGTPESVPPASSAECIESEIALKPELLNAATRSSM